MTRIERKLAPEITSSLSEGGVIPAHPLALDSSRRLDERHQKALTRYYIAAGASGIAVGVHTTQFSIREKGLLEPVLRVAAETVREAKLRHPFIKVAGVCGPTAQAVREAELASGFGYHLALVSPVGVENWPERRLLERVRAITEVMPVFGFYLQPAVGGRTLSNEFWKELMNTPGVMAIKVAPFSRYETSEVVRALANSERRAQIALYTGNDDSIVSDLMAQFRFKIDGRSISLRFAGGLLGQFAIWTRFSVSLVNKVRTFWKSGGKAGLTQELLRFSTELTDANSAIFDASNRFAGAIVGIQELLRRQGLVRNRLTLDPNEELSSAQSAAIDRVLKEHPALHLEDDSLVKKHIDEWLN